MPPKAAKAEQSTIKANFGRLAVQQWPQNVDPRDATSDGLSDELLYAAYGLPQPTTAGPSTTETYKNSKTPCPNRWIGEDDTPESPAGTRRASTASSSAVHSVEVIVIDSGDEDIIHDDDEDDYNSGKQARTRAKSTAKKGKGKARDPYECCPDNCKSDPFCLNWLGQEQWENDAKAFKSFAQANGLSEEEGNDREPGAPVGLRNLGATCYANSFLQVEHASPLFQLQVLFAFLQTSAQAVYDPEPFVASLRLDKGEQQDAQEFSKLFMSLLDFEFKKQGANATEDDVAAKRVGQLMAEQFEGSITYGTRCGACNNCSETTSTFLELEISLKNRSALEDRIQASLGDETLAGDNQYAIPLFLRLDLFTILPFRYFCEQCNGKRDAVRYTRLDAVPPVLHFSLLRFVFSMKDLTRQKSQALLTYPLEIDMGQFLPCDAQGRRQTLWYDLKGVLMHKGKSAYHGHYVAQVHDQVDDKWYLFDDESVTSIEDLNATGLYTEDGDRIDSSSKASASTATGKKKKPGAGYKLSADGSVMPQSSDAYMLIYTRRVDRAERIEEPVPPPMAAARVKQLDDVYHEKQQIYLEKNSKLRAIFDKVRREKRSVYTVWDQFEPDDQGTFVSRVELKKWVEEGLAQVKITKANEGSKQGGEIDGTASSSISGQVQPASQAEASSEIGKARLDVDVNGCFEEEETAALASDASDFEKKEEASADQTIESAQAVLAVKGSEEMDVEETSHTRQPKDAQEMVSVAQTELKRLDNIFVTCNHGKADPSKISQLKRISRWTVFVRSVSTSILKWTFRLVFVASVPGGSLQHVYQEHHAVAVKAFLKAQRHSEQRYYISKDWLKGKLSKEYRLLFVAHHDHADWKKPNPTFVHVKHTPYDKLPDSDLYEHEVVCPHGNLHADGKWELVSEEAVGVLKSSMPVWRPVKEGSLEVCKRCQEADNAEASDKKAMKEEMTVEKKSLRSLHARLTQTMLTTGFVLTGDDHVIPLSWARTWSRWLKGNGERPGRLDNSGFMCKHGRFCVDLEREAQETTAIATVTDKEWHFLCDTYQAGPPIRVWNDDESRQYRTSPSTCAPCIKENLQNFMETRVAIRMLSEDDFDSIGNRILPTPLSPNLSVASAKGTHSHPVARPVHPTSAPVRGTRSSARILNKPFMQMKRQLFYVDMRKTDTVKDLRMRIADKLDIPTICQRLFFNHQELETDRTVADLSLDGDAILELYKVEEGDIDAGAIDDNDSSQTRKGKGKRNRDEGFGGTGLFGWDQREGHSHAEPSASSKLSRTNGDSDVSASKFKDDGNLVGATIACSSCTFINSALLTECEMCGGDLPA
ncbi:hypothetical protein OIV83_001783 [Microbotryomycetes sp. JL201]|nr:hypothetical protein OIV83_001783 [Microbotryomycetes sp. JL201]